MVTLVERSSRYVMLRHLPDTRDSPSVMTVLSKLAQRLPENLLRSLTWDCGTEMAKHRIRCRELHGRVWLEHPVEVVADTGAELAVVLRPGSCLVLPPHPTGRTRGVKPFHSLD